MTEPSSKPRKSLFDLPVQLAQQWLGWTADGRKSPGDNLDSPAESAAPARVLGLDDSEQKYLLAVVAEPGLASSVYPKKVGMGNQKAQAIRNRLVAGGLLTEETVQASRRGRAAICIVPTPRGAEIAHSLKTTGELPCEEE